METGLEVKHAHFSLSLCCKMYFTFTHLKEQIFKMVTGCFCSRVEYTFKDYILFTEYMGNI